MRAWMDNLPPFPTTTDEYTRISEGNMYEIFPPPPLVPYDVTGIDYKVKYIYISRYNIHLYIHEYITDLYRKLKEDLIYKRKNLIMLVFLQ